MVSNREENIPKINTQRLVLRLLALSDVATMQQLCNDPDIAANIADMPYPYTIEAAHAVVSAMQELAKSGDAYGFAIVPNLSEQESLIGVIYLVVGSPNQRGELIYWMGKPFWGHGYMTEAVKAVVAFAFDTLQLHRVHASVFDRNLASVRVLEKSGLHYEGTLRQHILKNGKFIDLLCYGLLHEEQEA